MGVAAVPLKAVSVWAHFCFAQSWTAGKVLFAVGESTLLASWASPIHEIIA